jgi:hypothetical protein
VLCGEGLIIWGRQMSYGWSLVSRIVPLAAAAAAAVDCPLLSVDCLLLPTRSAGHCQGG